MIILLITQKPNMILINDDKSIKSIHDMTNHMKKSIK